MAKSGMLSNASGGSITSLDFSWTTDMWKYNCHHTSLITLFSYIQDILALMNSFPCYFKKSANIFSGHTSASIKMLSHLQYKKNQNNIPSNHMGDLHALGIRSS